MADEYPDPNEEFEEDYEVIQKDYEVTHQKDYEVTHQKDYEVTHQEDYEVLRELEDESLKKNQSSQSGLGEIPQTSRNKQEANIKVYIPSRFDEILDDSASSSRKRSHQKSFGDISDLSVSDVSVNIDEPKEKRLRWDQPESVIRKILDARQLIHENIGDTLTKINYNENKKNSISLRVPSWNFVAITRTYDCQRLYVRIRSIPSNVERSIKPVNNLLSIPYRQLKAEAEEIIARKSTSQMVFDVHDTKNVINDELWVDKYRPRSYLELLSDETVNRQLLRWLKFWDKIVFNRNINKLNRRKPESLQFQKKANIEDNGIEEIDSKGYPIKRIALLSGPPGLGKTTLAHITARHAGYNVVEINASDERSPDTFRQILLASTEMRAVIGVDPRPNCLIFDEIDGAPAASIDLLLKFVQGKLISKAKKEKKQSGKVSDGCARPVICICNELYAPTLRILRAAAIIIPVPEVSPLRLAERLMEITRKEKLNMDFGDLVKIARRSGCDVRSCVGVLQYMGNTNLKDNTSLGLKDSRKNLFDSWKSILTIPVYTRGVANISERVQNILRTIQNGESDKLMQGIFHNYPGICDRRLDNVSASLEWFQFYDSITSLVQQKQIWSLMPYNNYGFIAWHLHLARTQKVKLSYPTVFSEVIQKSAKNIGILTAIRKACGRDAFTLATDIAAFLPDLLAPKMRTVPSHLYSPKEKADIIRIVNMMLEFGLSFVQEKSLQGGYIYNIDPNILEVGVLPDCNVHRCLVYAVQQIIAQELEAERLRRTSILVGLSELGARSTSSANSKAAESIQGSSSNGASNAKQSERKAIPLNEVVYKDFFGNTIANEAKNFQNDKRARHVSPRSQRGYSVLQDMLTKHGIWYKYKEGCNNAVRRSILIEKLL